jgi:integrase
MRRSKNKAECMEYVIEGTNIVRNSLSNNEIDIYVLLDEFVSFLANESQNISSASIKLYIAAVRSYLAYYDIDVMPSKFRRKVKMPKLYREDEEPLDISDIRKILLSCNNTRLKAVL